jgi:hypothetical protein
MVVLKDPANTHAFPEIATSTEIKVSAFNSNASVIGACALALGEPIQIQFIFDVAEFKQYDII